MSFHSIFIQKIRNMKTRPKITDQLDRLKSKTKTFRQTNSVVQYKKHRNVNMLIIFLKSTIK